MADHAASERVTELKEHQRRLRAYRDQLAAEPAPEPAAEVTVDDLAGMREEIKDLVTNPGTTGCHGRPLDLSAELWMRRSATLIAWMNGAERSQSFGIRSCHRPGNNALRVPLN